MTHMIRIMPLVMFLLTACQPAPVNTYKPPSFTSYPPINLDVASMNVSDEYQTSSQAPNVEGNFPTTPEQAMRIWLQDRVHPVGGARTLQVIIKDASVVENKLPVTQGIKGAFTNEQGARFDARMEVEMRIYSEESALSEASISVIATRSDTLPESASLADRQALYNRMVKDLMDVMNGELEKNFYRYFANYIRYDN